MVKVVMLKDGPGSRRKNRRRRPGTTLALSKPVVYKPAFSKPALRERGSEYIVSGYLTGTPNKLLFNLYASAATLGPRLKLLSQLYEKYFVNSITLELQMSAPTTVPASVMLAFDTDIGDISPPETTLGIAQMASWRHNKQCTFLDGNRHFLPIKIMQPEVGWFTSYDPHGDYRFSFFGQVYLYELYGSAACAYTLKCTYDISFFEPQIELPVAAAIDTAQYYHVIPTSSGASILDGFSRSQVMSWVPSFVNVLEVAGNFIPELRDGNYRICASYMTDNATYSVPGTTTHQVGWDHRYIGPGATLTGLQSTSATANDTYSTATARVVVPPGSFYQLFPYLTIGGGTIGAELGTGLLRMMFEKTA